MENKCCNDIEHKLLNNNITDSKFELIKTKKAKKKSKKKKSKEPKRCQHKECNKKLGLVKINCKCDLFFCSKHRSPENHMCTYDYRKNNKINKVLLEGNSNFIKVNKI